MFSAHRDLTDDQNFAIDTLGVVSAIGTFFEYLPDVAALFTALWAVIRVYESNSVQSVVRWFSRKFQSHDQEKTHERMD